MDELRSLALAALLQPDPAAKAEAACALHGRAASLPLAETLPAVEGLLPGRPPRPVLVHPAKVPRRSPSRPEGLAALLHAIAHIEFNAINLALDAAWRFTGMPRAFHEDWLRVAAEEAMHFGLVRDLLAGLGHAYGDFPAHDNLWAMCTRTQEDIVARMALVPRTLEARGLDATPQIQDKLRAVGSPMALRAVEVLDIILRDEVGHVAIGNHWYRWLCAREGLEPVAHYPVLVEKYAAPRLYPPFNKAARRRAGFSDEELDFLEAAPGEAR
ncbi:ferritin-like domain-containing protein [Ramlibacter sp. MAHUQ-53]|uniref:ferritin-like domain-containing protein n=1 Tax=unclassified Ramlibacter TaxID=2617605 RepID=UPI00362CEF3E